MSSQNVNAFTFVLEPARPLNKFGKKFKIELSSGLGFSPATVMRAASGLGWNQQFEKMDYKAYRALLAWQNSQSRGSKMHRDTRRDLDHAFNPFEGNGTPLTPEALAQLPNSISSPWRLLFRTLRRQFSPLHRKLLVRLALYDRTAHQMDGSSNDETKICLRKKVLLPSVEYWHSTGFELPWRACVALDMLLQHLAWLDIHVSLKKVAPWAENSVVSLADPSKRPMRHWFDRLLRQLDQKNLADFYNYLGRNSVLSRGRVISHDLLKDWASTEELMPYHAVVAILDGCKEDFEFNKEVHCFWFARLLTFLSHFIGSFSAGAIEGIAAQKAVHKRLLELCAKIRAA